MNSIQRFFGTKPITLTVASLAAATKTKDTGKKYLPYDLKAVSRVRQDIKSWNDALQMAQTEEPKNYALQLLFNEIMLDALLTSQIENRKQQIFSIDFTIKNKAGEVDEEQTALLKSLPAYRQLTNAVLDSIYYGYNLVELALQKTDASEMNLLVDTLPRTNVVPQRGMFFKDYSEDKGVQYRDMPEYGTWILEFNSGNLGLLNKVVAHVLFKRFAQSCWSELCEIYGIPPRVMKTNTQDATMLSRATKMMQDMGAAAWFIIDETETFEWAQSVTTNGDVYKNLINLCSNEISLLISGAIIGQDTVNGNRSKDESAQDMLWQLVQSDMAAVEQYWNYTIIPALVKLGILKGDIWGEFEPAADVEQLFKFTQGLLPYYNINPDYVKTTFGIDITGERQQAQPAPGSDKGKKEQSFKLSDFFE